ncbi:MAG: thiol-disulfide oxidoreductase DCC family protein [Halomonadaceae bacterium]|uniref:DUF393 domain-containing protein n=1 Tax=Halomonas colorata TaxID=2742615 RepID=A0ABR9G1F6_9GAMM|nr:DUF393 domain-containing protein [Halomonas colorata]MBE0464699.1 DUF393 domain-containing protein [Halomonas colorata]
MSDVQLFNTAPPVTLYYDGQCPFCRIEVEWLNKHPNRKHIRLIDIRKVDFDAAETGYSFDTLMGQLHVRDNEGNWYVGMDASRALYATLGYRRLVKLSCLPGLRGVMNAGYRFFARRRIRLGQWWEKHYSKRDNERYN